MAAGLCLINAHDARADFTLNYTGHPFDTSQCTPSTSPLVIQCLSGNVQYAIHFSGSLPENYTGTIALPVNVVSAEETVGGNTYSWTPRGNITFQSGAVTQWQVDAQITSPAYNDIKTWNSTSGSTTIVNDYAYLQSGGVVAWGRNNNIPGAWSIERPDDVDTEKNNGVPDQCPSPLCANPINVATGNKLEIETDYVGAPNTGLTVQRAYNSAGQVGSTFGSNWTSVFGQSLSGTTVVNATRADGRVDTFTKSGTTYTADPDVTSRLSAVTNTSGVQTGWKLVRADDTSEYYNMSGKLTSVVARSGQTTTLTYNASNQLDTVTGPFGHKLKYAYNTSGFVSQITLPDGKLLKYGYDGNNNLATVTRPDGKVRTYLYEDATHPHALTGIVDEKDVRFATFAYDAQGRGISSEHAGGAERTTVAYHDGIATVTDPNGATHDYQFTTQYGVVKVTGVSGTPSQAAGAKAASYDANGFAASMTDNNGNVTTYSHDARGLELSRTEAFGTPEARTITTTWHSTYRLPKTITEPGRVTTYDYYDNGDLKTLTVAAGGKTRSWSYTYAGPGQVATINGPRTDVSDITTLIYDGKGDVASLTNALGQVTQFTNYDPNGRLTRMVDPNGLVTTYAYNWRGEATKRVEGDETTTFGYNPVGDMTSVTTPDGVKMIYGYDNAHRFTGITDPLGNRVAYTLNGMSDVTLERHLTPAGAVAWQMGHTYNPANQLVADVGASGQTTTYGRDPNGNLTGITDPLGRQTILAIDPLNRVSGVTDPMGGTTTYGHNALDQVTGVTDPNGNVTSYSIDGLGNTNTTASPDTGTTANTFDAAGNVKTSTDARNVKTTNTYDPLNRITRSVAGGLVTTYTYDQGPNGIGHMTGMTYPGGSTTWSYDPHGRPAITTQAAVTASLTTGYGYDHGRLASITYPSGKLVEYGYDGAGRVSEIDVNGVPLITGVTYEPFGPVSGWTAGNGTIYRRAHDADGDISTIAKSTAGGANRSIVYGFDAAKQITGISDSAQPAQSIGYDDRGRVDTFLRGADTHAYGYDDNGNRTSRTINGVTNGYGIDPASNRLLGVDATTYGLNATGDLTNDGARALTFDARDRLTKVVGTATTTYWVDGLGQRVSKSGNGALAGGRNWFAYGSDGNLLGEYTVAANATTANPVTEHVYLGDLPVGALRGTSAYNVYPDQLGAPWTVENSAGGTVWSWNHDPFGNGAATGTLTNYNIRFPGQYYDKETGRHYNGHRDYDPKTGRYIESDPIGLSGGLNTFAYVGGNPVSMIDPSGLDPTLMTPDPNAEGPHASFSRGPSGQINKYTMFEKNPYTGDWRSFFRFRLEGKPHGGMSPPLSYESSKPGGSLQCRPATPLEIPTPPVTEPLTTPVTEPLLKPSPEPIPVRPLMGFGPPLPLWIVPPGILDMYTPGPHVS